MKPFLNHVVEHELSEYAFDYEQFAALDDLLVERLQDIPVKVINSPRPASGPFKGQQHRLAIQRGDKPKEGNHWQRVRAGAHQYFSASKEEQHRMHDEAHKVLGHVSLLGDESSNPKLTKSGEKVPEYRTKGLTLAPSTRSGIDVCPAASSECKSACLGSAAGRGVMKPVQDARAKRTRKLFDHPHLFYAKLDHEIQNAKQTAQKNGQKLAVRLNVASDVPHEHLAPHLFSKHSDVQFYDYTKVHGRTGNAKKPNNLHLTVSSTGLNHGESNWKHVRKHLDRGGVAAMAFDVSSRDKNAKLPSHVHDEETGKLYRVVDGDEHDHRHLDKKMHGIPEHEGVIAGLKFKGGKPNIARAGNFAVHAENGVAHAKKGMN